MKELEKVLQRVDEHYGEAETVTLKNGLRVEYAVHGADHAPEKILLIMGLIAEKVAWLPVVATMLETHGEKCQLVSFDNRGIGGTDAPTARYTTTQMALDAMELMDHLQWKSAHIVGIR